MEDTEEPYTAVRIKIQGNILKAEDKGQTLCKKKMTWSLKSTYYIKIKDISFMHYSRNNDTKKKN